MLFFSAEPLPSFIGTGPSKVGYNLAGFCWKKSVAVLPFENLSDEKQNVHFTEGVHDEILTNLARSPI